MDKEVNKGDIKIRLLSNLFWSVKKVFFYKKGYFASLCINSMLKGITPVVMLLIMQKVIEAIQYQKYDVKSIMLLFLALACFELFSQICQIYTQLKLENYELEFDVFFQTEVLNKIAYLDCKEFEKSNTYDLINRTQYDADAGIIGSVKMGFSLLSAFISTFSYIVIIFRYNAVVFFVILITPIIRYFFEKKYNLLEYEVEKKNTEPLRRSTYISYLLTNAEHFKEIKMFSLFDFFIKSYKDIRNICNNEVISVHNKRALIYVVLIVCETAVDFLVTVTLLIQAFKNVISIGKFILYSNSIDNLKENIISVFSQISFLYKNAAMIEQIKTFFELENEDLHIEGVILDKIESIKFINVSYKYQNQKEYTLRNISFEIKTDQTCIIMGYNGSGKSTLMKILMGIYNDYEGSILVNNLDRKKVNLISYREKIGVLFQDYIKFETTIEDNIAYGNLRNYFKKFKVDEIMAKVQLNELLERKKHQLGYQFNEGLQLSVGQWQKLALGRTLISDSDVHIFDEPNASIDLMSEDAVLNAIMDNSGGKINIIIMHRFNRIVEKADTIITLNNGCVEEVGKHTELLNKRGFYFKLHSLQKKIVPRSYTVNARKKL
ncbi:MAG: ABC transporter ATP-binding protein/permease [Mogibacterium diversum]|jgi:subtilin transport ATP-binding protein spaT|uniref:ATP-binding cassette domain-containing protein n=1 Tax=Mogibacterium TaxID=86331 RepID=UPI0017BB1C4E|nr:MULTISPECIES: ABC transporter ATP-binding protein [Mogibacterium]MBB1532554.1 ABC transporter ATP-binding protein [Mogibacterium sp.]UQF81727.1 MAG: ABC transporter ATP-binding protein/permease [Mogibacterium diversum]